VPSPFALGPSVPRSATIVGSFARSAPVLCALALVGCKGDEEPAAAGPAYEETELGGEVVYLSETDRLTRISMTLRGIRPSLAEYERVQADPEAVQALVDEWLDDPYFGETVKDMYAEALLIRADTEPILLSKGPLEEVSSDRIFEAMSESSLRLIEDVVMSDASFQQIVTADWMWSNEVLAEMYGVPYDHELGGWQKTVWGDERPVAGILSDNGLWMRYPSNGSNFHRGRANFVAATFLCDDFNRREIAVEGGIDLSDDQVVAEAVTTLENCVGCHQALEPLSTFFWGFRQDTLRTALYRAYFVFDCEGESDDYCYPLQFYKPEFEDDWQDVGLMPPGYYGVPGETLVDLGHFVADDPRFAECTARRVQSYFHQTDLHDAPVSQVAPLQDVLIDSGYDLKELAREVVLSDAFAVAQVNPADPGGAGPSVRNVRPEQLARTVADLTGFELRVNPGCSFDGCFHDVDLTVSDRYGFRAMAGGVDGLQVTRPPHTPTPTKVLYVRYLASEAASYVVDADFAQADPAERALLLYVDAESTPSTDPAAVTDQLVHLHARILGEFLDPAVPADAAVLDATEALLVGALDRGATPAEAWELVIATLLQDPRMLFY